VPGCQCPFFPCLKSMLDLLQGTFKGFSELDQSFGDSHVQTCSRFLLNPKVLLLRPQNLELTDTSTETHLLRNNRSLCHTCFQKVSKMKILKEVDLERNSVTFKCFEKLKI
jgi:hypothetical protein